MIRKLLLFCVCASAMFAQTASQITKQEIVGAGRMHGTQYKNALLGLTYELPKSVELDEKFAATASPDAVLAALDRKWKDGRHQNIVVLSASQSGSLPEQFLTSRFEGVQQQPGFRWIEQPHEVMVGGVRGWFAVWELHTAAAVFAARSGKYLLVWGFGAIDEKSMRELTASIRSVRITDQP